MKNNLKKQYRDLEMQVFRCLRDKVEASKVKSKHVNSNSLEVNVFDYVELVLVNDILTFIDSRGLHYSIFSDASLEDLIDILKTLN